MRRRELEATIARMDEAAAEIDKDRHRLAVENAGLRAAGAAREAKSRRRVVVNLKSGEAIDGVIWRWTPGVIELKGAKHVAQGVSPTPLDGIVIVLEPDVDFIQDPAGE